MWHWTCFVNYASVSRYLDSRRQPPTLHCCQHQTLDTRTYITISICSTGTSIHELDVSISWILALPYDLFTTYSRKAFFSGFKLIKYIQVINYFNHWMQQCSQNLFLNTDRKPWDDHRNICPFRFLLISWRLPLASVTKSTTPYHHNWNISAYFFVQCVRYLRFNFCIAPGWHEDMTYLQRAIDVTNALPITQLAQVRS